tara:strand:+ start:170 stop:1027 length:858 start_codon:yes stop_codon:yes gene_type:complete
MIIWLASYPKSGNTFLRSLLSSYFFSSDGVFDFKLLKNIKQFPDAGVFNYLGIDTENESEVIKNYLKVQEEINKRDKNSTRLLKTHNSLHEINGHKFTDLKNSLGVIYIVRDPRNIIRSFSNHNQITLKETFEKLTEFTTLKGSWEYNGKLFTTTTHIGTWPSHFLSWKAFKKQNKYILIRYEDLTQHTEETLLKILSFISELKDESFILNKDKFRNVIKTTTFNNMKELEKNVNFPEAVKNLKDQKVTFFKYGPGKKKEINLPIEIKNKVEKIFEKEMIELGYL